MKQGSKKKNGGKNKRLCLAIFALCLVALTLVTGVFVYKNKDAISNRKHEYYYQLRLNLDRIFTEVRLKERDESRYTLKEYTLSEIKKDPNIHYDNSLILINSEHKVYEGADEYVGEYKDKNVFMHKAIMKPYEELAEYINKKYGKKLYISSAYRTREKQEELAASKSKDTAAAPDASEHRTGLALDVYVNNYAGEAFIKSREGVYVNLNAYKYGLIIRYPENKTEITGIKFEPWHLRYVGVPHAEIMYRNDLCLEEYIESLKVGVFYEANGYIISRQSGESLKIPQNMKSVRVSPDNTGCYIITAEKP
ncbi:MAG TPA: M15 family metallopeptidase [Clostridiales bacterium]|nr:M15 family metallopeptidase [Clostridiales bacterium]HPP68693.1 M15 family metallopeptidase [Clostridiales bacterium]